VQRPDSILEKKNFVPKTCKFSPLSNEYSPEEGLKIELQDKSTGKEVILPLDSCNGTILIKVFDCFHRYSQEKLI
jgi:hypothetical protein